MNQEKIKFSVPKENLLYEFGLFLDRLGPERALVIAKKRAKILPDHEGISLTT
ncbi:MAG: TIR domain-containing protein [Adhaeribacter sp.]